MIEGASTWAILVQAAVLLIYAGRINQMLTDHNRRIGKLEDKGDAGAPEHAEFRARLDNLEKEGGNG